MNKFKRPFLSSMFSESSGGLLSWLHLDPGGGIFHISIAAGVACFKSKGQQKVIQQRKFGFLFVGDHSLPQVKPQNRLRPE